MLHGILGYLLPGKNARRDINLAVGAPFGYTLTHVQTEENPAVAPTPNNPPWGSAEALGVWVASVILLMVVPALFLVPYLLTRTPPLAGPDQMVEAAKSDPTAVALQIAAILPAHILTLLLAWVVVTRMRKYKLRQVLGLDRGGFAWWHYCIILGAFYAIAGVVGSYFPEQENELIRILRSSRVAVYAVALIATFTAPLAEEVVYRGLLYPAFQRTMGVPAAFLLVTFLFALVHVPQYYPSYSTIFLLTLLSVVLTLIRVRAGSLLPCIILHTIFNAIQSILLLVEPYFSVVEGQ